jgi:hypothetical protein
MLLGLISSVTGECDTQHSLRWTRRIHNTLLTAGLESLGHTRIALDAHASHTNRVRVSRETLASLANRLRVSRASRESRSLATDVKFSKILSASRALLDYIVIIACRLLNCNTLFYKVESRKCNKTNDKTTVFLRYYA